MVTRERLAPHRGVQLEAPARLAQSYREHGDIVTAILRGDGVTAAHAMRRHVGWVSFYAVNLLAIYVIYHWLKSSAKTTEFLYTIPLILIFEGAMFINKQEWYQTNIPDFLCESRFSLPINLKDFQASLPDPYFNTGSGCFSWPDQGDVLNQTYKIGFNMGLPSMGVMMSRTSFSQSLLLNELTNQPYKVPKIIDIIRVKSTKPLLVIESKKEIQDHRPKLTHWTKKAAVASHTTRAAEKLRAQQNVAGAITVSIRSNPFKPWDPQYNQGAVVPLPEPSADTRALIRAALWGLSKIFRPGYAYKKAGVRPSGLEPVGRRQASLLTDPKREERAAALMAAMDQINDRWGRGSIRPLATGFGGDWWMRREKMSPAWTTRWEEVPVVWAR